MPTPTIAAVLRRHRVVACSAALLALGAVGCRNDMHDQPRYEPLEASTVYADSQASRPMILGTVPRGGLRIDQQMYAGRTGSSGGGSSTGATSTASTNGRQNPATSAGTTTAGSTARSDSARRTTAATVSPGVTVSSNGVTVATTAGADQAMKGFSTTFPFPVTREVLLRGRERFNIYCSPCHGRTGSGDGMIVQRGFKTPPSFHEARLAAAPVGYIFDVITNGFGAMYPYASRITPEDRWKIVAYIRALQLSRNASVRDLSAEDQQNLERMK